ncbi:MAG: right-handed parallel beta-helix repeat-containing protein [Candidatus Aminicenantes bacterium]|nr:right-handed parallel beta-helix repeat-containing protein [Candidatus Aminicenantes bacterium]
MHFVSGEDEESVLQGFPITGGSGTIRKEPNGTVWREGGGIFIRGSSPTIKNNLIMNNKVLSRINVRSTGGGGISCNDGNPKILNNIIMLNQARYEAGIMLYRSGVILKNNIICQNSGGQIYIHHDHTTADFTYNNIEGEWDGKGNMHLNPEFTKSYFLLSDNSPCIDAGDANPGFYDPLQPPQNSFAEPPGKGTKRDDHLSK